MITPVFAAESGGSRVYKVGRVGLESGNQDTGGPYTATLKTERISPLGLNALLMFRRVACRIWLTGGYTVTMTVYVDGKQTQIYSATGVLMPQAITFAAGPPTTAPIETWIEASIRAPGTYVEVQLVIQSNSLTGIFLPAEMEVNFYPIRTAKERKAQSS
jgi:hypothetical protein